MPQLVGKEVGTVGYGLMGLTWKPQPESVEDALKAMKAAFEAGCTFWNGGEFYGTPEYNSLHLIKAYFTKYPEDASKVVLSIKGALDGWTPIGTPEYLKKCIDRDLEILAGTKTIDIYECARVDKNTPIEVTLKALEDHVKKGDIGGIGLSEVSAATIEKAASITKIAAVEAELSLWSLDILENGVAEAAAKHGIPIAAYSPIGRGFLTGALKSPADIPEGDLRHTMPRFSAENFPTNLKLVEKLQDLAKAKGVAPSQLAVAWVLYQSRRNGNPEFIPIPGASSVDRVKENSKLVTLDDKDFQKIEEILKGFQVKGTRYNEHAMAATTV